MQEAIIRLNKVTIALEFGDTRLEMCPLLRE
jgi:hypothetical protein